MDILFRNNKMQRCCNIAKEGVREWGEKTAKKLRLRLVELRAAATLAEVSTVPPTRCHCVDGVRKGCWSVDLGHPFRLLFVPFGDDIKTDANGNIDISTVHKIEIWEVEDYHGKQK